VVQTLQAINKLGLKHRLSQSPTDGHGPKNGNNQRMQWELLEKTNTRTPGKAETMKNQSHNKFTPCRFLLKKKLATKIPMRISAGTT
jgi:hypothetical protein